MLKEALNALEYSSELANRILLCLTERTLFRARGGASRFIVKGWCVCAANNIEHAADADLIAADKTAIAQICGLALLE